MAMIPSFLKPTNAHPLGRNAVIRIFIGLTFNYTELLIQEYVSRYMQPPNRAQVPIPIRAFQLIRMSLVCARTTSNVLLRNQVLDQLNNTQFPLPIATQDLQLPLMGTFVTNDTTVYCRLTLADEIHIQLCIDNGTLRAAVGELREFFRTTGIHCDKLDFTNLIMNAKACTLNVYHFAGQLENREHVDVSQALCEAGSDITTLETIGNIVVDRQNGATQQEVAPGRPRVICLDNNSDLIGRYSITNNRVTWIAPEGYNNWAQNQYLTLTYCAGNLHYNTQAYLALSFGLFVNANCLFTVTNTFCLKNFISSFTAAELNYLAGQVVTKLFGDPEPIKPIVATPLPQTRSEIGKSEVSTLGELKPDSASRGNSSGNNQFTRPDNSTIQSNIAQLGPRPIRNSSSFVNNQRKNRNKPINRDVSASAYSYRPLARNTLTRTKFMNMLTDFFLLNQKELGFNTKL